MEVKSDFTEGELRFFEYFNIIRVTTTVKPDFGETRFKSKQYEK